MRVVLVPDTALVTLQEGNKWWDVSEADLHVAIGIRFRREGTGLQGRNEWRDVSEANSSAHVDIALNHVTHNLDRKRFDSNTCRGKIS